MSDIKMNINIGTADATKNIDNLNKSLEKTVNGAQTTERSMREMRMELKDLQIAMQNASKAGDMQGFKTLQSRFVEVRKELGETRDAMKFLDPGALLGGWVGLAQGIGGAFATASGAIGIFTEAGEEMNEAQKKSIAIIQTLIGLEQVRSQLIDGGAIKNIKSLYDNTQAYIVQNLTIKAVEGSTKSLTVAQLLWNKAVAASPIVILVAAVAALAAGIVYLVSKESEYTRIKKEQQATLKAHNNIRENTAKSMAGEVSHLSILMTKLKDVNTTQTERTSIIRKLNESYSDLIGYQINEKASLDDLKKSYDDIIQVLYRKYQTQAVEKELVETFEKRIAVQRQLNALEAGGSENIREYINLKKKQTELEEEANKVATTSTQKYFEYQQEILKVKDRQRELEISNNSLTASAKQQEIIDAQNIDKKKELTIELSKLDKGINGIIGSFSDYLVVTDIAATNTKNLEKETNTQIKFTLKYNETIKLSVEERLRLFKKEIEYRIAYAGDLQKIIEKQVKDEKEFEALTYDEKIKKIQEYYINRKITEEDYYAWLNKLIKDNAEKVALTTEEQYAKTATEISNYLSEIEMHYGIFADRLKDIESMRNEEESKRLDAKMEADLKRAGDNEKAKDKIKEKYQNLQEKREAEYQKKQKKWRIIEAIMDGAQAILKVWSSASLAPSPLGTVIKIAESLAVAALTAVQVNNIKKAKRGMLVGPKHENGGMMIEAEGGEAIINARSMAVPAYRNIASAINVAGGGVPFSSNKNESLIDYDLLASKINDKKVYVTESDISKTQKKVSVSEKRTQLG